MLSCCVAPPRPYGATFTLIKTLLTNQVGGVKRSDQSVEMPKRFLEEATQAERATQRQKLGTLKELTVQPATGARYSKAVDGSFLF